MYSTSCLCLLFQNAVTTDRERMWGTRRCASSSGNDSLHPWHGVVLRPILHPKCLSRLLTSFHPEAVRQSYRQVLTELLRLCRPSSQLSPEDAEKSFQDTKLLTLSSWGVCPAPNCSSGKKQSCNQPSLVPRLRATPCWKAPLPASIYLRVTS